VLDEEEPAVGSVADRIVDRLEDRNWREAVAVLELEASRLRNDLAVASAGCIH